MDFTDKIKSEKQTTDFVKGEEWVTTTKYDSKGNIIEIGCVDTFWGNVSTKQEQELRSLGEKLANKISKCTTEEIVGYWKKTIQKKAPIADSKERTYCRYVLLGAGYSVSEIKALERIIDGN